MSVHEETGSPQSTPLRRPLSGRIIAGVAAGLAEYLAVDVAVVRIALVALTLLGGIGIPVYLAAWLLVPREGAFSSALEQWLAEHR